VPVYERLIQAGVRFVSPSLTLPFFLHSLLTLFPHPPSLRRQTILIMSAKQKEEEELAQCTFQPAIPRESEALAVKAFAEEYQQLLQVHDQDQGGHLSHSMSTNGSLSGHRETTDRDDDAASTDGQGLRRIGSSERLVRRGLFLSRSLSLSDFSWQAPSSIV
jgi:hypothetical protein